MKWSFSIINVIVLCCLILLDFFIYVILGLLFMNYEDHFDGSKGDFLSIESMSYADLLVYIGIHLWFLANLIIIAIVLYKVAKSIYSNYLTNRSSVNQ